MSGDKLNKINIIRGRYGCQPYKKFTPRGNQLQKIKFQNNGMEMELLEIKNQTKVWVTKETDMDQTEEKVAN